MEQRLNFFEKGQAALRSMYALNGLLAKSTIEKNLLHMIYFRVSQINGCAFCLDMHSKDLRAEGEDEQRMYVLNAWRETPFFTERERAALAWAEAITASKMPDDVYNSAAAHFTEEELVELNMAVIAINSYNRINIAFPQLVGTYQPGQFA